MNMDMEVDNVLNEEESTVDQDKPISIRGFHHCEECNVTFRIKKNYKRHIKYKHKIKKDNDENSKQTKRKFICEICNETFTDQKEFCVHKLLHTEDNCCTACNIKFATSSEYKNHVNDHLKSRIYNCIDCNKSFEKIGLLIKNDEKFKCDQCYKKEIHLTVDQFNNIVCHFCGLSYTVLDSLKKHLIHAHNTDRVYKCGECEEAFPKKADLLSHINSIHKPKNFLMSEQPIPNYDENFVCSECNEKFPTQRKLNVHKLLHNENDFKCTVCNKEKTNYNDFKEHVMKHLKFSCKFCPKMFLVYSALQTHTKVHTDERPFKCDVCKKAFKQNGQLNYHKISHDIANKRARSSSCDICNGTFTNSSTLRRHMRRIHKTVGKEVEYTCNVCKERFKNKYLLCAHVSSSHSIALTDDSVVCVVCLEVIAVDDFQNHKTTHTELFNNVLMCKVCNKRFLFQKELDYHMEFDHFIQLQCPHCIRICSYKEMKVHVENMHKEETCEVCGVVFHDKLLLRKHMHRHKFPPKVKKERKPKPPPVVKKVENLTCENCLKVFARKHYFDIHVKERVCTNLTCDKCDKVFTIKSKFNLHLLSHGDIRPLQCRMCNLKYKFPDGMIKHFRQCHKEEAPFFCFTCKQGFNSIKVFTTHVQVEHGIEDLFASTFDAETHIKVKEGDMENLEIEENPVKFENTTCMSEEDRKLDATNLKIEENLSIEGKDELNECGSNVIVKREADLNCDLDIIKQEIDYS